MFSFASKMLNTLIGEGENPEQTPQGLGGQQPQPMFRPPTARPQGMGFRGPSGPLGPMGPGPMGPSGPLGPPGPQRFPTPGLRPQGPRTDLRPRLGMVRPQAGPSHMMQRPPPPVAPGDDLAVDLSHLSEEERALIQNVMAKAKEIEEPPAAPAFPPHHMDMPGNGRGMGLMDGRNLGPGMDGRALGVGMDGRSLGTTLDGRGMGPGLDGRLGQMDSRGMGQLDSRGMGQLDSRGMGQLDSRGMGQLDSRGMGQLDSRGMSQMDRGLGTLDGRMGQTDRIGQMDGRMGQPIDSRGLGQLDGGNMGPTMDGRSMGPPMDGRGGLGQTMNGRTADGRDVRDARGGQIDAQHTHRQELGMARPLHSSFQSLDNRQDSFKVCQDSFSSQQKDSFLQQRQDSAKSDSFFGNNVWEAQAPDKEPRIGDPCEYPPAGPQGLPGSPVDGSSSFIPDRLSPGSPYSTSPTSDDESSREKTISEIKLDETLISNTESEELDKKVNNSPSIVGQVLMEPFYDHSPGEVYTIPEEEEEISSPTSGDGVTSLRKRRLVGGQMGGSTEEDYGGSDGIYSRTFPRPQNPALRSTTSTLGGLDGRDGRGELSKALHSDTSYSRSSYSSRAEESAVSEAGKRNGIDLDHFLEKNSELGLIMKQQQAAQQAKQQQQLQQKLQQQLAQEAQQHQQQMQQQQQQPQTLQQHQQSLQQQQTQQQAQQQQQQTQQQQQQRLQQQQQQLHDQLQQQHQLQTTQEQQRNQQIQQQQSLLQHQQDHLLQQTQQQKQQQINQQNLNQQNQNIHQQNNHQLSHQPLSHQTNSQSLQQQSLDHKSNYSKSQMDHISSLQQERQIWDRINNHSYGLQKDYNQDHLYQQKLQQERMQEQEYSIEQKQFLQRSNEFTNSPLHRGKPKLHEFQGDYLDELGSKINPLNFQKNQQQTQQQQQQQQQANSGQKPSAGTISGMLADFSRALGLGGNSPSRPSPTDERLDLEHGQPSSQQYTQDYHYNKERQGQGQGQQQQPLRPGDPFFNRTTAQQQQPGTQLSTSNPIDFQQTQQQFQQQTQFDNKSLQQQQYLRTQQHLPLQEQQQQQLQQQQLQAQHQQQFQQQQQLLQAEQQLQQQHKNQQVLQQQQQQQQQHLNMLVQQQQHLIMQQQRQKHQLDQTEGSIQQTQFGIQKMQHEYHPMFAQNLTPQQQQMYQQHMQLQHHAQHLKKIRRSLPNSSMAMETTLTQGQLQKQKKDNMNMLGGASLGSSFQQQVGTGSYLTQGVLLGQQLLSGGLLGGNTQNRLSSASSQPIMSSSILASGLVHSSIPGGTPIATPQSTPVGTPRGPRDTGGDSSDTLSETDSQKSLRMRRKLPTIPPDQEAAPLPTSKKRDRNKNAKAAQQAERFRTYSPLRQYTSDSGYPVGLSNLMLQRPSASETNLRKVSMLDSMAVPRPGSALGLLQGSSVVSSSGVRISSDYGREFDRGNPPLTDLVSCLPPDLRHLLGSYKTPSSDTTTYSKQYNALYDTLIRQEQLVNKETRSTKSTARPTSATQS